MPQSHDVVVIGSGPGGYVAAIRAAQFGLNVACIEKVPALGGTCLRVGCIPSKALLESSHLFAELKHGFDKRGIQVGGVTLDLPTMLAQKDQIVLTMTKGIEALFRKHKITRYLGHGKLAGPGKVVVEGAEPVELAAKQIILATGSAVATLPGVKPDGQRIGTSTEALSYQEVPKRLIVIGGGYIGLELGSVWSRLGSQVVVLEYLDRILPGIDNEIAAEALKIFKKQGLEFHLGTKVLSARSEADRAVVECEGKPPFEADRVLLAVGRVPYSENLGLETVGLQTERGRIPIDDNFRTKVPGIFAIGDLVRGPMLAHKAEDEGVAVAEYIGMGHCHVNYDVIPAVVYTYPEIATVGKTTEELEKEGIPFVKGVCPYRANARARTLGDADGFVKILAHAKTDRVLGVHIIGNRAGDMIAEAATAMEFGASSEDIARTCHAHPTLSEIVKEAALAVANRTINF